MKIYRPVWDLVRDTQDIAFLHVLQPLCHVIALIAENGEIEAVDLN